jgi:hypothetical protein
MDDEVIIQIFGAFCGAFFAFFFFRLAEFFKSFYDRQVKNYNSLVNLETQLNEFGGILSDNLYILSNFIKNIENGKIFFNILRLLPINREHYENFLNTDIINDLFIHNYQARKVNDDIDAFNEGYRDMKNAFIQKNISREEYQHNANILEKSMRLHILFEEKLQEETINLMARVRARRKKDRPLGSTIMGCFFKQSKTSLKPEEIDTEFKIIKADIEKSQKESQKEIDKILSQIE